MRYIKQTISEMYDDLWRKGTIGDRAFCLFCLASGIACVILAVLIFLQTNLTN